MHSDGSLTDESQSVLSAFNAFFHKLQNNEWLSRSSKEDIKNCLHSAQKVETVLQTLDATNCLTNFTSLVPNLLSSGFDINQLKNVSDIVLTMVLTAPGVSLVCARTCFDEYFKLYGSERFEQVLSSVIFCSEIYRVLLDYLASSEGGVGKVEINLQSNIFSQIWKSETDVEKMQCMFYEWLKADTTGQNVAVALMIINSEESNTSMCLINVLTKVLCEREELAVVLWQTFIRLPQTRKAAEKSSQLLRSLLQFLKTTAEWMETTATFAWISREKGPCREFGFNQLVDAVKSLLEVGGCVSVKTHQFLLERRNSVGCTFWDDIDISLDSRLNPLVN